MAASGEPDLRLLVISVFPNHMTASDQPRPSLCHSTGKGKKKIKNAPSKVKGRLGPFSKAPYTAGANIWTRAMVAMATWAP